MNQEAKTAIFLKLTELRRDPARLISKISP